MISISGIVGSFFGFIRKCQSLKGQNKRVIENESEYDVEQPEHKFRKVGDFKHGSSLLPLLATYRSNLEHLNRISEWLMHDESTTIGICGMGGIGKTTLAMQVHSRVLNHELPCIDGIVWIPVGMCFTVQQLQHKIAKGFGIDLLDEKDDNRRAAMLHALLSRGGKHVLILDHMWEDFRREQVGIPKHCKLIITSRSLDVCRMMHCQKVIKIEPLLEDESWQLFRHIIECSMLASMLVSREVKQIAQLVCRECAGVPLAITTLAKGMRRVVDACRWRESLKGLKKISTRPLYVKDVFPVLKLSYDSLSDMKLKRCFLYSALYPKDYAISREELIHLWIGELLIDDTLSLQPQYDKGHCTVNKFLDSSLLETCEDKGQIKMHDLVRDMAIATTEGSFMVKAGIQLTEIPTNLEWREDLHVVTLMKNCISRIPEDASPKCPNISTLLLQHNPIQEIPDSFFLHMRALHVLNLSDTNIVRLPSSMSDLEELRVLDVSCCQNLSQLPSLAKLQQLRYLDISYTAVVQVPHDLGDLKMLTELNLSSLQKLKKFPRGLLEGLFRLKRLGCSVVGTIHELQSLRSLEILDARFLTVAELSSYVKSLHWRVLDSFHLQVGNNIGAGRQYSRRVSLQGCSLTGKEVDCIVLPDNIQELCVADCIGFRSLSDIMNPVDVDDHKNGRSCSNPNRVGPFSSLEICTIRRCHDVVKLFTAGWMQNLQSLELLEIEDCVQLKELIEHQDGEDNHAVISLPQLKQLVLTLLPQLNSIHEGQLVCASIRSLTFMDCPKLHRLPFAFTIDDQHELILPTTLEWIEGQEKWWELLEWDQPMSKALLEPLFRCKSTMYFG